MKRQLGWIALFLVAISMPQSAYATVIADLYNTGVDALRVTLPDGTVNDPHYDLVAFPGGTATPERTNTSASGFPVGPWLGDNSLSTWIGPNSNDTLDGPAGSFQYDTTFTVVGNAGDASAIIGQWAADDGSATLDAILLNGN